MAAALDWLVRRPIAHRGLHNPDKGVIENCRAAFVAAISGGFSIECDVQRSADGAVIVFHDFTLERLTHGTGAVATHSLSALRSIAFRSTNDSMMTLDELFALVAGQVGLVVEVKSQFDGALDLVRDVATIAAAYRGPLAIMSFDPDVVAWLRDNAPHLTRGLVAQSSYEDAYWQDLPPETRRRLAQFEDYPRCEPDFLSWRVADLPNAATVLYRSALRKPVICWTVRTDQDRARAAEHADQITFEGFVPG